MYRIKFHFCKVFELIILNWYSDDLTLCDFKENISTDMCTMVLKETVSYYVNNVCSVFCTFRDVSKAFDRIVYCQLFRLLIKRGIPSVKRFKRLLCNANQRTRLAWNDVYSTMFSVLSQRGWGCQPHYVLLLHTHTHYIHRHTYINFL